MPSITSDKGNVNLNHNLMLAQKHRDGYSLQTTDRQYHVLMM